MSAERAVIVGAGQGGFQAAASLRQDKFAGSITLIGDEPGLPYQRPPLSKAYLKTGDASKLALRPAAFFETAAIDYAPETRIAEIDRAGKAVIAEGGTRHPYDHLILAMGSRNKTPPIENLGLQGVLSLRTLADAEAMRARMPEIRHAIVVGGGFIGLEFAAVARVAGVAVTVVEALPRLMARAVSPAMSSFFEEAHRGWGAELIFGRFAASVIDDGAGRVAGLRLNDGTEIQGDVVLVAAGVAPNVELAEAAGLEIDNGVAVDALMVTSDPSISALGDCCSFPEPTRGIRTRLESVQAATDHARTISKRLTGTPSPYTAAPWFWSDQGDLKLQIAGLGSDAEEFEARPLGENRLAVYGFDRGKLICIETVGAAAEHMAGRKILNAGRAVTKEDLLSADYDLRSLAKG